jgi:hypothetical protein
MNSALRFSSGESYQPVDFDGFTSVNESGDRVHTHFSSVTVQGRTRITAKPTVVDEYGTVKATPQPPPSKVEDLADRDDRVADALRFFERGDWINLYKAWEVVSDAAGGPYAVVSNGWADEAERRRFTGTAQSRDELGDEARHASEKYRAPKNPMTLGEAQGFVRSVIRAWVATL